MPGDHRKFTTDDILFLTCSYAPDIGIFEMLCESIDLHAPGIRHVVLVPRADLSLFRKYQTKYREVFCAEEFLPSDIIRIPMPAVKLRRRLGLPYRDQFLRLPMKRLSGWLVQQIVKLEVSARSSAEIIIHFDSDAVLFRDFDPNIFMNSAGQVRLFREEASSFTDAHKTWEAVTCDILGLEADSLPDRNYVSWPVSWRASVVRSLRDTVEKRKGRDWRRALSSLRMMSEYHLYGIFAEFSTATRDKHFLTDEMLMAVQAFEHEDLLEKLTVNPNSSLIGCCIQSTIEQSLDDRRNIINSVRKHIREYNP